MTLPHKILDLSLFLIKIVIFPYGDTEMADLSALLCTIANFTIDSLCSLGVFRVAGPTTGTVPVGACNSLKFWMCHVPPYLGKFEAIVRRPMNRAPQGVLHTIVLLAEMQTEKSKWRHFGERGCSEICRSNFCAMSHPSRVQISSRSVRFRFRFRFIEHCSQTAKN